MGRINHRGLILESDDFQNMVRLQTDLYRNGNHDWTLGRLYAWKYGLWTRESRDPEMFSKSAELFFNEAGQLLGFIVLEECGGNVASLLSPDNEELLEEMLHFLDMGGNFGNEYSIYCSEKRFQKIKSLLYAHRYCSVNYEDTAFEYNAKDIVIPEVNLPDGYILTDQSTYLDMEKMERFRFFAFNPDSDFDEETAWAFRYSRNNPLIKKELCIVLLDENKEPVSSCVGYFDVSNSDMEIEVVCTKKEAEGKGFAKAVIAECIRKGVKMGAERINISGWNPLTKHLYSGFVKCRENQKICISK